MDKIELYRASIQALLQEHNQHLSKNNNNDVENELFFDIERDQYQLMRVGWQELKRVYYTIMHFEDRKSVV